jgi:hypothetical protein
MNRTEEQILSKAPFEVTLGSEKYSITPLAITPQMAWRETMSAEFSAILSGYQDTPTDKRISAGLIATLTKFPEKLCEMVFSYAPDLPKDKIMLEATEEQLALAFSSIMSVAFPFLAQLEAVTKVVRARQ